jgi:ribose 5-phosphate isomerase B
LIDLVIGSDHRGYNLKESISKHLIPIDKDIEKDITTFLDCGCYDPNKSVDYPNVVKSLATELNSTFNMGILICGSGLGVCIAANRYKNIRAVTVRSVTEATMARKHNNANVLCLGADFTNKPTALRIVDAFLTTKFEGGRHQKRLEMIS